MKELAERTWDELRRNNSNHIMGKTSLRHTLSIFQSFHDNCTEVALRRKQVLATYGDFFRLELTVEAFWGCWRKHHWNSSCCTKEYM